MERRLTALNRSFQFTRPRGARPSPPARGGTRPSFNSRAHGGRDPLWGGCWHQVFRVSIHAPTGGATWRAHRERRRRPVSIHAPTGGATRWRPSLRAPRTRFNSRAHGGRDWDNFESFWTGSVSIHAPTGGATYDPVWMKTTKEVSIHAPTGGATGRRMTGSSTALFQFTRPRGARPESTIVSRGKSRFQFTRPRGARP